MHRFPFFFAAIVLCILVASCETDPCEAVSCQNGGTCIEGTCSCPEEFEGELCERSDATQFTGTYAADYGTCVDVSDQHQVVISPISGDATKLVISNLGDYACPSGSLEINADLVGTQVTIAAQNVDCGDIIYSLEGSGSFQGPDVLKLSFVISYLVDGKLREDQCEATLEK